MPTRPESNTTTEPREHTTHAKMAARKHKASGTTAVVGIEDD
jgi:hypothetical protein